MAWIAGVDGCRAGWFRAARHSRTQEIRFDVLPTIADVLDEPPRPGVVAVDIPIGLPEAGQRACDRAARRCLGPRRSSVFRAPIRPSLRAASRARADAISRDVDGKGVSAQLWGLYPKIRSVDEVLASDERARSALREVHPEVSFWAWQDQRPMRHSKKTRAGRFERARLAEAWLGGSIVSRARGSFLKKHLADDDILDAIAALWTARRIERGRAVSLPDPPPVDATGLPMEIVY